MDKRGAIHDGVTPGGIPEINCFDSQNQTYSYGAGSGTDTITVSMAIAPSVYQTGQRFTFKAANTNTGSATLNINSLGAKTLKKKDVASGALVTLSAGDIIQGGIYTAFYNGNDMILEAVDGGGIQSVSQGDLNTSTGQVSTDSTTLAVLTLPGGAYGFYPQTRQQRSSGSNGYTAVMSDGSIHGRSTSFATAICMLQTSGHSYYTAIAQQRYVTSSPPFNLGNGDMAGFVFAEVDRNGTIISTYSADVPPWAYNGPTSVRADYRCPITGKKYRRVKKQLTTEEILDGVAPKFEYEEITQDIKNADMLLIPHPFGVVPEGHKVILLDTQSDMLRNMIDYQNAGGGDEVQDIISKYLKIDNDPLDLISPNGVTTHAFHKK